MDKLIEDYNAKRVALAEARKAENDGQENGCNAAEDAYERAAKEVGSIAQTPLPEQQRQRCPRCCRRQT